jgi:hypothetical protein
MVICKKILFISFSIYSWTFVTWVIFTAWRIFEQKCTLRNDPAEWAKLLQEPVRVREGMQLVEISVDEKRFPPCACQNQPRGNQRNEL